MTPRQWAALAAIAYEGVAIGSKGRVPTISQWCRRLAAHFIDQPCSQCRAVARMERQWTVPRAARWYVRPPS